MLGTSLISDPWFYAASIPALLLTSISKGSLGLGLGVVAVPLIALHLPVPVVVTLLLPLLCVTDLITLWQYRGEWSWPLLRIVIPAGLAGLGLGMLAIHHLSEAWLRLGVGVISIDFARRRWLASRQRERNDGAHVSTGSSIMWGTLSGFASFMANAGEPALAIFLLPHKLSKRCFAGTTAAFFAIINFAKLASFSMLGLFTRATLLGSLVVAPVAILGIGAGVWLNDRLDVRHFYQFAYVILVVIGARMVYTSLRIIL
ncbi:MAG TPA: sulfite exporter TauE/SafE family protein [Pararobbsia sp.]|nr:sulfite exporter TauE/SafE family protein [Pararobbsia sp.]